MKKDLIVKDNALINASYNLDLVEQRLILLAVLEARENSISIDKDLTIHADSYIQHFKVARQTAYTVLKDACKNLFERRFSYQKLSSKGNIENVLSRWVQRISYVESEALVRLRFSDDVIPLISQLEKHFTSYELEQVSNLTSIYSIRLYELLISWRSTGSLIIALEEFRKKLGIQHDEYPRMDNLKRKVLDIAISQINEHTDIIVSYKQHKAGRTITGFSFTFTQKKQPKNVTPKAKKTPSKPQHPKQEEQIDWMTTDILDRFIGLSSANQQTVLDKVETSLKGAKKARFKAARSGSLKQLMTDFSLDINEAMMTL
ncbi:MAG TPA: replication initiation protein RepM [Bacteroidia bacterium]|nr:replication initiation protein RepM [Rhodocyclaceae bacterium]HNL05877.1 replication initiation protein RepM [Bacteroidia bacterium]